VLLRLPLAEQARFHPLLQRGVATRLRVPRTALEFLVEDLGLDADYVQRRITTVFLDGSVVDSLSAAPLKPGSLLALSAAMPGLVGATLRRGGPYAAMRAEITRPAHAAGAIAGEAPAPGTALVRVKLFNLLLDEIGPALLAWGIVLERGEALEALGELAPVADGWPNGAEVDLRVQFA
jgi:hypothetical protein